MLHFFDPVLPILMGPSGLHPVTNSCSSRQAVFFLGGDSRITVVERRPNVLAVLESPDLALIHRRFSSPANALIMEGEGSNQSVHITLSPPTGRIQRNRLWLCSDFNGQEWQKVFGFNKIPAYDFDVILALETTLVCTYRLRVHTSLLETLKYLRSK